MANSGGGYFEKLGNRYELRWAVYQMHLVLMEQRTSVTIEEIGDDERGVDLWVDRPGGIREAQQCKRANRTKTDWSIADLDQAGVLQTIRFQLSRSPLHRFLFVSSLPVKLLPELASQAREAAEFDRFERVLQERGKAYKQIFGVFCKRLGLHLAKDEDAKLAWGWRLRPSFRPTESLTEGA